MPFRIIRADITRVIADAIVNTANPEPTYAAGTDYAIYTAAGAEKLLAERKKIGRISPGEAAVTPAFNLHAKYIIHTVGPAWIDGDHDEIDTLASCYRNALLLARQLSCASIAFPLISTGIYGFPKDEALTVALDCIREFLDENEMDVTLVVFDKTSFALSSSLSKSIEQFIDENYVAGYRGYAYPDRRERGTQMRSEEMRRRGESLRVGRKSAKDSQERDNSKGVQKEKPRGSKKDKRKELPRDSGDYEKKQKFLNLFTTKPKHSERREAEEIEEDLSFDASYAPSEAEGYAPSEPAASAFLLSSPAPSASLPPVEASSELVSSTSSYDVAGRSLQDLMNNVGETFQQCLLRMIDERGLTDAQVYKKANIDRKLFSKIRCNEYYTPTKRTALSLAIALGLNLDETVDLLGRAGFALSPSSKTDLIVKYCIVNKIYDMFKINSILFHYDQQTFG